MSSSYERIRFQEKLKRSISLEDVVGDVPVLFEEKMYFVVHMACNNIHQIYSVL